MKCALIETAMIDYIDNKLDKEEREKIDKHLISCERCLDMVKDLEHIFEIIDSNEQVQPNDSLRNNFNHMLEGEINKLLVEKSRSAGLKPMRLGTSRIFNIAAGFALILAGTFIGIFVKSQWNGAADRKQFTELKTEVQQMKELVMLNMLKEQSPSQRIQAVNYTDGIVSPDQQVLDALTTTLNNDKNVNVRLAAAYSLARYADKQSVTDSLVATLTRQTEPIIQIVLINILTTKKIDSAIGPIQQIISNENTLQDVREMAEERIKILL